MKKVTMIVMPGCPYCANAKKALAALQKEAAYRDVQVELVDETSEADKVKPYAGAYYYVPTLLWITIRVTRRIPAIRMKSSAKLWKKRWLLPNNFPANRKPAARGVLLFCRFLFSFFGDDVHNSIKDIIGLVGVVLHCAPRCHA